jgi:hypothetical protein
LPPQVFFDSLFPRPRNPDDSFEAVPHLRPLLARGLAKEIVLVRDADDPLLYVEG